jgi:acyl-lipid omega-6 desaturase (Delta-12 desaturase)
VRLLQFRNKLQPPRKTGVAIGPVREVSILTEQLTAREAVSMIPAACLNRDLPRALSYFARDILLFAGLAWVILALNSWLWALPFTVLLGTVLTGIFVVGHDCGHRSFGPTRYGDWIGEIATAMTIWPFHIWRLSHDIHHRHTHNIEKDIAWVPFTLTKLERLNGIGRGIYLLTRTTLWFIGSWFFTFYFIKDGLRGKKSRHFRAEDLPLIRRSLIVSAVVVSTYFLLSAWLGGWYGVVYLFLLPQLVVHFWLSTFTLLHHTHKDATWHAAADWSFAVQLRGTTHVAYPRWVEWLTHDINWHVPHHVCVGVPHYHLREAHRALRAKLDFVREETFSWRLLTDVIENCHAITSKQTGGLGWQRHAAKLEAAAVPADA